MKCVRRVFCAAVIALLMLLCACAVHYDETNIHRLYDADWIVGKTREEIQRKYGEFKREYTLGTGEDLGVYYVNYDNGPLDASYIHDSYCIFFDETGVAVRAEFRETSRGG